MLVIFSDQRSYGIDGAAAVGIKYGDIKVGLLLLLVGESGWRHRQRCWFRRSDIELNCRIWRSKICEP